MITGLEQLDALVARLDVVEARAAKRAAPALLDVAKGQWAVGRAPDGTAWPKTKDRRVALTDLTSQATAHADGSEIVVDLPDELAFHQNPTQPGHPRRQTIPDDGDDPPFAWVVPIENAITAELEK